VPSKRTLSSNSPLATPEARKVLASIKRDLRRVKRYVEALQPISTNGTQRRVTWDISQNPAKEPS
jgi:hypothetical protein